MSEDGRVGSDSPIVGVEGVLRGWPGPEGMLTGPAAAAASTPNTAGESAAEFDRKLKEAALAAVSNVYGPDVMRPGKKESFAQRLARVEARNAMLEQVMTDLVGAMHKMVDTIEIHNDILELRHA